MAAWKNLDTLASYSELSKLKNHVDIAEAMSGAKEQSVSQNTAYRWQQD